MKAYFTNSNKIIFFLFCLLIFPLQIFGKGNESFDHLAIFKSNNPPAKHPVREEMFIDNQRKATAFYFYNTKNQIIKAEYLSEGEKDGHTIYNYNSNGLESELLYNKNGELAEKLIYTLDEQGNISRYDIYNGKDVLQLSWTFDYNKGKLVGGRRIADKKVNESFSIEYPKNGNKIQHIFSENEKMGETIYIYQDEKLKQRRQSFPNAERVVEYNYNSQGQLSEIIFSSAEKNSTNFKQVKVHTLSY